MSERLRHPFWQSVLVLLASYVLIRWGIPYIPPLFGVSSAPVPASVTIQYMLTILVGVLVWVSDNEVRWKTFKEPIGSLLVQPERKMARRAFLVALPLLVAFVTYDAVRPKITAPAGLRSVHPANPTAITVDGESMVLEGLENPFRLEGREDEAYDLGLEIYYQNCMACHGDYLDGQGHFADAFNPLPLPLRGGGTIAQLTESYVLWRIAKGGPGLPREGAPWNSAMPAWEDFLTLDEMWAVTLFLYRQAGISPRTWEEH
jgi:mono/diheme cytochrome c family protein